MNFVSVFQALMGLILVGGSVAAEDLEFRFEQSEGLSPAPFRYDPISGRSEPNQHSRSVDESAVEQAVSVKPEDGISIEAFAKPLENLQLNPKEFRPVVSLQGDSASLSIGLWRSRPPHSYVWWQARVEQGQREYFLARQKYGGNGMVRGDSPWRHVGLVWNPERQEAEFYLDYQLQETIELETPLSSPFTKLSIGGSADEPFPGLIDEVRVASDKRHAWEFWRASAAQLSDASFEPKQQTLPPDFGHVDVRLHYGAVGDGVHDDTEAIRRAFAENENRVPIEYRTVYFPPGTYRISDTIRFSRFMVVRGAGPANTIIQLADNAQGYNEPEVPKPAFVVGYDWPYVGRTKRHRAGNAIGSYVFDLSIDTGRGNPSALGLDFHCNNVGCLENVDIRSGDGSGMVGLDLKRGWPGPCLIKNVSITGFDYAVDAAHREYSMVFSNLKLKEQRIAAIRNRGNILSLENVVSKNSVPALENEGGGLIVLLNSRLEGGDPANTAITSDNASVYLRDVTVSGYGTSLRETTSKDGAIQEELASLAERSIAEYFTGPQQAAFEQSVSGSLKLPIKSAEFPFPPLDQWVSVLEFQHLVNDGDWAPAIQAAVDSGKQLVYFPEGFNYRINQDVVLRGSIRTFVGCSPKTGIATSESESDTASALVLDPALPIFKFHMLDTGHIRHEGPTTLILDHCGTGAVSAGPNCGDMFINDAGGKLRVSEHQRIWGRQLNPETKGIPEIVNEGGQLWILGLKTEYLSTKIVNTLGARTELLGGLMYPVHPVTDESLPMFINQDSDITLVHGVSVYNKNHKIYMQDTRAGETRDYTAWDWIGGRPLVNLYRSSK